MPKCTYCDYEKEQSDLSQEHVIPRGIDGNIYPVNPFSLNTVCKRCNSLCGTYVDGPFIKYVLSNDSHEGTQLYLFAAGRRLLDSKCKDKHET